MVKTATYTHWLFGDLTKEVHYLENSLTVIALPCDIVTCTKLKVFKSVGWCTCIYLLSVKFWVFLSINAFLQWSD